MGPLSGKQQREYMKFAAKEQRESAKAEADESRKQELHEVKLIEAKKKANQGLNQKHAEHIAKMSELGGPLSGKPEPIAEGFSRGTEKLSEDPNHPVAPSDTVPAMLTPGEAVIPKAAAQDPANKPIIEAMVEQGREAQGFAKGTSAVPRLAGRLQNDNQVAILPKIGPKRKLQGYAEGTTEVPKPKTKTEEFWRRVKELDFSRAGNRQQAVPVQVAPQAPQYVEMNGQVVPRIPSQVVVVPQVQQPSIGMNIKDTANYGNEVQVPTRGYADGIENVSAAEVPQVTEMPRTGKESDLRRQVQFNDQDRAFYGNSVSDSAINADAIAGLRQAVNNPGLPASVRAQMQQELNAKLNATGVPAMPQTVSVIPTAGPYIPANADTAAQRDVIAAQQDRLARAQKRAVTSNDPVIVANAKKIIAEAPVVQPNIPVPGKYAGAGRGSQGVGQYNVPPIAEQVAPEQSTVPEVLPDTGAGAGRGIQGTKMDTLGYLGQKHEPELNAIVEQSKTLPAEEQKSFLEKAFSGLFGDKGLFNDRELLRAGILFAGGVATGGSVKGSLRYAGLDTLQQSDKRLTQDKTETLRRDLADQTEEKDLRKTLLGQMYSPEKVEAFIASRKGGKSNGDPSILGDPKTTTSLTGATKAYTFSSGPLMGKQKTAVESVIKTGKRTGDKVWTIDGVPIDQYASAIATAKPELAHAIRNAQMVPYAEGSHSAKAIDNRYNDFAETLGKSTKEIYTKSLGPENNQGKANSKWSNIPTPSEIALQTRQFFKSRGDYDPDDLNQRDAMHGITQRAINSMVTMNANNKESVQDITPYLAREILMGKSGVPEQAFMIGNKQMSASKIAGLDDKLKGSLNKTNPNINASELEQKKASLLKKMWEDYKKPEIKKQYRDGDEATGFYQYVQKTIK